MTDVLINLRVPSQTGVDTLTPTPGSVRWTPTRPRVKGDSLVLPVPFTVSYTGPTTVTVDGSEGDWCWKVEEIFPGYVRVRYLAVPISGQVGYEDLVDVDPQTLATTVTPEPAWWSALDAQMATVPHLWTGTQAQYDALGTYDSRTFYAING